MIADKSQSIRARAYAEALLSLADDPAHGEAIQAELDGLVELLRVQAGFAVLGLVEALAEQFRAVRQERADRVQVEAITASALDEPQRRRLIEQLEQTLSLPVVLQDRVDPELIGGLMLRIGDTLLDGSVAGRLERMRRQVTARGEHAIQDGRDFIAD